MARKELPQPLTRTITDLNRVMVLNEPPLLNRQQILELMHLDGDKPDGKTLAGRLLNLNRLTRLLPPTEQQKTALRELLGLTGQLLARVAEKTESPDQLTVADNLIAVAERQIDREGNICPIATDLYLSFARERPDMVNQGILKDLVLQLILNDMIASFAQQNSH